MVQQPQSRDQTTRSNSDIQNSSSSSSNEQSAFASVAQVSAFGAAQRRELDHDQEQQTRRTPRLVQRALNSSTLKSPGGAAPTAASKKKLLSMAMQAQKQRREAALAAGVIAATMSPSHRSFTSLGTKKHVAAAAADRDGSSASDVESPPLRRVSLDEKANACDDEAAGNDEDSTAKAVSEPGTLRLRTTSGGSYPKSLTLAESEPLSLLSLALDGDGRNESDSSEQPHSAGFLDSPVKLMPPADPEIIRSISISEDDQIVATDAGELVAASLDGAVDSENSANILEVNCESKGDDSVDPSPVENASNDSVQQ